MSSVGTLLRLLCKPGWASGTSLLDSYERAFVKSVVGDESLSALAFWRGRVALWTILRAAGLTEGDEVIVPAYTCEMVPAAVKFAGCKCVYVDVEPGRFNTSPQQIAEALTKRTRAILCQHTYGVVLPMKEIASLVAGRRITVVEDCCHLILPNSKSDRAATTASASFFSAQWSKPFSTGLGGMAVFSDEKLRAASKEIRETFSHEKARRRARSLAMQVLLYTLTVRPKTRELVARLYRWGQHAGMIRGTTTAEEYEQTMPADYLAGALNIQAVLGMEQLHRWDRNVQHRRMLTKFYLERLEDIGVDVAPLRVGADEPALWGVPLLLENQREIIGRAKKAGLPIIAWFGDPPVHVVSSSAARYDYRLGQCPASERLFSREAYLLTAPSVTLTQAEASIGLLQRHGRFTST